MVDSGKLKRMHLSTAVVFASCLVVFSHDLKFSHNRYDLRNENFKIEYENLKNTVTFDKIHYAKDFTTWKRNNIAKHNFFTAENFHNGNLQILRDGEVINFNPGDKSLPFSLWSLRGKLAYPSPTFTNKSIFIHVFNPGSAFLECIWTSDEALMPLINESKENTSYIFIPKSAGPEEKFGALWMQDRFRSLMKKSLISDKKKLQLLDNFHFSVQPLDKLGNWIPSVLSQWQCVDHNCGLDQVVIQSSDMQFPLVTTRLDARYDWLPSPVTKFGNKTLPLVPAGTGCEAISQVNGKLALVSLGGCSYIEKISYMTEAGAVGVVIYVDDSQTIQDMNCNGTECGTETIPATMIRMNKTLLPQGDKLNISFQNTPSENFFMAIDFDGRLAEVGWFLFPSMKFLIWQSQWFNYKQDLDSKLMAANKVVNIFDNQTMQGVHGVVVNVTLPDLKELRMYDKMELDMSLSCPGTRDTTCPHWDHTINLYVCCDKSSPLCGMELGRWISAFRRRIGRWLTDVSPLLPLLNSQTCTFTMKSVAWAMPWIPSLKLRFSQPKTSGDLYPAEAIPLYEPGATFDKNYNFHFKPISFNISDDVQKAEIFAVITGHGSDENGCGEFCVTSHYFTVNNILNNITFGNAGSPFGCADRVLTGVEPNEHGTWLYGRNGWCDGQNVFPWVIDITGQLNKPHSNKIRYFGYFNGTDPNPKENPGIIYIYSYLVLYRKIE